MSESDTDHEWLAKQFEFEVCGECGWGASRHTVTSDPLGLRHACCDDPLSEGLTDEAFVTELARRMAASTSVIPEFDYARTEREALAKPGRFVPMYPDVVLPGGDVGGDYQDGESYDRRFVRFVPELPDGGRWEVITDYFYLCKEEDDDGGLVRIWVENQPEGILCRDLRDAGGTEEISDTHYTEHDGVADEESARVMASVVTADSYWALPTPVWLVEAHRNGTAYPYRPAK